MFAVVDNGVEDGRALCFLRYVRDGNILRKVGTEDAHSLLECHHSELLFHSRERDALLHGVPLDRITRRYLPRQRVAELMATGGKSVVAKRCGRLLKSLAGQGVPSPNVGVTGSLLVGAESDQSDIDLVIFCERAFKNAQRIIGNASAGDAIAPLPDDDWRVSYQRRNCELSLDEYVWHERRKHNKAMFERTKFDIALGTIDSRRVETCEAVMKLGIRQIVAEVIDATRAFEFPARFEVEHESIQEVLACTPTYSGQAFSRETIEVSGMLEQLPDGQQRLVVGDSREAKGQWIRVVRSFG